MKKSDLENRIIFLSLLTLSFTTTKTGISYTFVALIFLLLIPKFMVIIRNNISDFAILFSIFVYRYLYCNDSALTSLNLLFCGLSFFYIIHRQYFGGIVIPKLYIKITFFVALVQFFTNYYFGFRLNEIWSDVELYRPNGLSIESSYGSTLICVAGIALGDKLSKIKYVMITITVIMMNSGFGFISWLILSLYRFNLRIFLIPVLLLIVLWLPSLDFSVTQRISSFGTALQNSLELSAIMAADHSASVRIVPLILVFTQPLELWYHLIVPMPMNEYTDFVLQSLIGVESDWKGGGFLPAGLLTMGAFGLVILRLLCSRVFLNGYFLVIFLVAAINIPFSSQSFFVLCVLLRIGFINKNRPNYDRLQISRN